MNAIVYCKFREFYWFASVGLPNGVAYGSLQKTHGSTRQAADEVLAQVRRDHGPAVTMRRLGSRTFEITVPEGAK
jgi:hypothetical protein